MSPAGWQQITWSWAKAAGVYYSGGGLGSSSIWGCCRLRHQVFCRLGLPSAPSLWPEPGIAADPLMCRAGGQALTCVCTHTWFQTIVNVEIVLLVVLSHFENFVKVCKLWNNRCTNFTSGTIAFYARFHAFSQRLCHTHVAVSPKLVSCPESCSEWRSSHTQSELVSLYQLGEMQIERCVCVCVCPYYMYIFWVGGWAGGNVLHDVM